MIGFFSETDSFLAAEVREKNNNDALELLISRHSGIYMNMIQKFGGNSMTKNQINDMIDEKNYQIYKAALEYDETKSKFSTYLALKTKYICLTNRTNNKKNCKMINFEDLSFSQECKELNPSDEMSKKEIFEKIILLVKAHPEERVRKIMEERYFLGTNNKLQTWKKISEKVELSIQGCINIHDKAIKEIQEKIKNEKLIF